MARRIALAAILLMLPLGVLSCGDDDVVSPEESSPGEVQEYFAQLDEKWEAHIARLDSFEPSSDDDADAVFVLTSMDQMLREIGTVEAPPEARDAQRRLVDAFSNLVAEMRESIDEHGATATAVPNHTESPHKLAVDEACADLAAVAAAYSIDSEFMCLGDSAPPQ